MAQKCFIGLKGATRFLWKYNGLDGYPTKIKSVENKKNQIKIWNSKSREIIR